MGISAESSGDLLAILERRAGSKARAAALLSHVAYEVGLPEEEASPVVLALSLVKAGMELDRVAESLSWRDFESFCAMILRTRGYHVLENLTFTRPRAQMDLLASSDLVVLAVDCKHWKREMGHSSLSKCAEAQRRRAKLLRMRLGDLKPIVSVILLLADEQVRFVAGAATVPVRRLWSFIDGIAGYDGRIEFD